MTENYYDTLRQVERHFVQQGTIPTLGELPPFPFDELKKNLVARFELSDFSINIEDRGWISKDELLQNGIMEQNNFHFSMSPLEGNMSAFISSNDILVIAREMLFKNDSINLINMDEEIKSSVYTFLALEILDFIDKSNYLPGIGLQIVDKNEFQLEDSYYLDISMSINDHKSFVKLILPLKLQKSWSRFFTLEKSSEYNIEIADNLEVDVGLSIGNVVLTLQEWQNLGLGDFIILDSCSWDFEKDSHNVNLTLDGDVVISSIYKEGQLEIKQQTVFTVNERDNIDCIDKDCDDVEDFVEEDL